MCQRCLYNASFLLVMGALILSMLASGCKVRGIDAPLNEARLAQAAADESPSVDLDNFNNRALWIDVYGSYASACISATTSPGIDKTTAVFNGCYDWHSAVHAHWAVLRADLKGSGSSLTGRANAVNARFTDASLMKIRENLERPELLNKPADWELPYGRAWFLRLASEHEIWSRARGIRDSARLRSLGDFVATQLMNYYTNNLPSPLNTNYKSDSWSMAQLLNWFRHVGNATAEAQVLALVKKNFRDRPISWSVGDDTNADLYFSTYWNWVYVITTAYDAEQALQIVAPENLPSAALTPIPEPASTTDVHHLGVNWSRAWGVKALARDLIQVRGGEDPTTKKLVAAYYEHVRAGRARHEKYKDNYYSYSHWVPQFGIYAITD
jgi:hypothetical protein